MHALGQVAHLDLTDAQLAGLDDTHRGKSGAGSADARAARLARRMNGIAGLSSDLYVKAATIAPAGFDARFSASWRRYEYRIADRLAEKNPLLRASTLWYPSELDPDAMNTAATSLVGLHDFAAYCKPREGATTIRTLQRFEWLRDESGVLVARLEADAFCHSMVRALVGASVAAGEGNLRSGVRPSSSRGSRARTSSRSCPRRVSCSWRSGIRPMRISPRGPNRPGRDGMPRRWSRRARLPQARIPGIVALWCLRRVDDAARTRT